MSLEAWGTDEPRDHDERCPAICYWIDHNWASEELMEGSRCPNDHVDHECTCGDWSIDDAERDAQAFVDWQQATFNAWERNNG